MPFRAEMVQELQNRDKSVRTDVLQQLDRVNVKKEEAERILPILTEMFVQEPTKKWKKLLASLVVKCTPLAHDIPELDVPELVEWLTLALKEAKSRNDTFCAFGRLRSAASQGWDITPAIPLLLEKVSTQWVCYALETLADAARNGIDVLEFDTLKGLQAWELFRLTLKLTPSGSIRHDILNVLTELARHRASHLEMFLSLVEEAVADTRMSKDFLRDAAACLAAFQAAGVEPD